MGNIIQLPKMGLAGEYRIKARKSDGSGRERILADWFSNNITEVGLDNLINGGWKQYCQVGTGTTPATNNDTALATPVLSTSAISNVVNSALGSTPWYTQSSCDYTFPVGAGTYTEVGVASGPHDGSFILFSRALIVDSFGDPTAITVLADEYLVVTYRIRNYPPLTDVTGNIGVGSDTHAYTVRANYVNLVSFWIEAFQGAGAQLSLGDVGGSFAYLSAHSGAIQAIPGQPSGEMQRNGANPDAYVPGSRQHVASATFTFSQANDVGYIRSLRWFRNKPSGGLVYGWGSYQVGFVPDIVKNSGIQLTFTFAMGWGRYAP